MTNGRTYKLIGDNHYHDGELLRTGATFTPTEQELEAYGHKMRPVVSEDETETEPAENETDDSDAELEDAREFVDRTPMDKVVEDIEAGEADEHLEAVRTAEVEDRDRDGVLSAIDAREE